MKDLYKILGVSPDADDATLKKTYRKLAKELHPDATGGDKKKTERFKEINEAYAILGDTEKRAEYDRLRKAPVGADGMPQGFDAEAFARAFGGGRPGGRGGVQFESNGNFDLNDIFSSLFGGEGRAAGFGPEAARRPRPSRGQDLSGELELSFAEAALGTKRSLRLADGQVEVSVPGGVEEGGRLRVPGKGGPPPGRGGTPGDLYLDIQIKPDPYLSRNGDDVEIDVPITVPEAFLGGRVSVPTVEGPVTVTIPPGTSSGAKLRLRGKGAKRRDGSRGDQICRLNVVVPKGAAEDPDVRRIIEDLAKRLGDGSPRSF